MRALIGALALSLTACGGADDRICETAPSSINSGDMMACVHKWAYRLARSDEPASVVAKAVVSACNDVADYAAERAASSPAVQAAADPEQVRTEAYRGNIAVGETQALFRVVQARAGNCNPP